MRPPILDEYFMIVILADEVGGNTDEIDNTGNSL